MDSLNRPTPVWLLLLVIIAVIVFLMLSSCDRDEPYRVPDENEVHIIDENEEDPYANLDGYDCTTPECREAEEKK